MTRIAFPLPPAKASWRGKDRSDRQCWLKTFFSDHPVIKRLIDDFHERLDHCICNQSFSAMLVLGASGSGKTRLTEFLKSYVIENYSRNDGEKTVCPVVVIAIPDPCTPYELCLAFLEALGEKDSRKRRTKKETIAAAGMLLKTCEVRVVLIDNIHDIPARRAKRGIELVGARLRDLMDASTSLWVFLGTNEALKVVNSDPQLVKRIGYRGSLPYFDIASTESQKTFRNLLRNIDKWLPMTEPSCLIDPVWAGRIYIATEGIFDRIVKLVDRGWYEAFSDARERMTATDLEKAFRYVYGPASDAVNPFSKDFVVRRLNGEGEPFEILNGDLQCC